MSATIDERVVEMRFDNKQFEAGAKETMNTLERLKSSMDFTNSAKSFNELDKATQNISLDGIAAGVEFLQKRFSTLGIVGMQVIQNLTNSLMGLVNKGINFVTDSIVSGGIKRAMNIENAHFQLQALLKDEEKVQAVMADAMDSVTDTAYAYDEAAKAASQFAATGLEAGEDMQRALKGITGVAAMTNSEYEGISRIFTTVAGNGRLMGDQLLQLSSRGLNAAVTIADFMNGVNNGTVEVNDNIRNAVQTLSKGLNTTEADIREFVTDGKISFDIFAAAMGSAFGDSAKRANETFTGAFANMKASLAKIGAGFISPIVEQNSEVVLMFNAIKDVINEVKKALVFDESIGNVYALSKQFTDTVLSMAKSVKEFLQNVDVTKPLEIFYYWVEIVKNGFKALSSILGPIAKAFQNVFLAFNADDILNVSDAIESFTYRLRLSDKNSEKLKKTFEGLFRVGKTLVDIFISLLSTLTPLEKPIGALIDLTLSFTSAISEAVIEALDWIKNLPIISQLMDKLRTGVEKVSDWFYKLFRYADIFFSASKEGNIFVRVIRSIRDALKSLGSPLADIMDKASDAFTRFRETLKKIIPDQVERVFHNFVQSVANFKDSLASLTLDDVYARFQKFVSNLKESFKKLGEINLADPTSWFGVFTDKLKELGDLLMSNKGINAFVTNFKAFFDRVREAFSLDNVIDKLQAFRNAFTDFVNWIKDWAAPMLSKLNFGAVFAAAGSGSILYTLIKMSKMMDKLSSGFGVSSVLTSLKNALFTWQQDLKADMLLKLAKAIFVFAAALTLLSFADMEQLVPAAGILTVVSIALMYAFSKLEIAINRGVSMNKVMYNFAKGFRSAAKNAGKALKIAALGSAIKQFAESVAIIVAAIAGLALIYSKNQDAVIMSALIVGGIVAALLGIMVVMSMAGSLFDKGTKNFGKAAMGVALLSFSLTLIVNALSKLFEMDFPEDWKVKVAVLGGIMGALGALTIVMAAAAKISDGNSFKSGSTILVTVISLRLVVNTLKKLFEISLPEDYKVKLGILAGIFTGLTAIILALGYAGKLSGGAMKAAGTILAMSVFIGIIVAALMVLCTIPQDGMIRGALVLETVLLTLAADLLAASKITNNNVYKVVMSLAITVAAISASLALLSVIPVEGLLKGTAALGSVLLALAADFAAASKIANDKSLGVISAMAGVILFIAGSLYILADKDWDGLLASGVAMGLALLAFGESFKMVAKAGGDVKMSAIGKYLAATLAVVPIAVAIGILGDPKISWENMLAAGTVMTAAVVAFSFAYDRIAKAGNDIKLTSILKYLTATLAVAPIGYALYKLSTSIEDGEKLKAAGVALSQVVSAMGLAFLLIGKAGNEITIKEIGKFLALTVACIPIVIEIAVLAQIEWPKLLGAATALSAVVIAMSAAMYLTAKANPDLATIGAFAAGCASMYLVAASIKLLCDMPIPLLLTAALAIGEVVLAMSVAMGIVATVAKGANFDDAMEGVLMLDTFIVNFAAVLGALGLIFNHEVVKKFMAGGIEILEMIGVGIGKFVGGIVGGVLEGIFDSLPDIANSLTKFMENLQPFFDSAGSIDSDALSGVKSIAEMILVLTGASLLDGISNFLSKITGSKMSFEDFGREICAFAPYIKRYSNIVNGINTDSVTASAAAAEMMAGLYDKLPKSDGLAQKIFGESKSLSDFGKELLVFAPSIKGYGDIVNGINTEAVEASASAAEIMANLYSKLPKVDGFAQKIFGEAKTLSDFGTELILFGPSIVAYSQIVTGIDHAAVEASANSAKIMAALYDDLPEVDGLVQKIFGETKSLSDFGEELRLFGASMVSYSNFVKGVDGTVVITSANCAKALAELYTILPEDGGFLQMFSGSQDISEFGRQIRSFGEGLADYYDSIKNVRGSQFNSVTKELRYLIDVSKNVEKVDTSALSKFGGALGDLAEAGIDGFIKAFDNSQQRVTECINGLTATANTKMKEGLVRASFTEIAKTNIIEGILGGLTIYKFKLMNGIRDLCTQIVAKFGEGLKETTFSTSGAAIINSILSGFNNTKASLFREIYATMSNVNYIISEASSDYSSVGSKIIGGIMAGLNSVKASLFSLANDIAWQVQNQFQHWNNYNHYWNIGSNAGAGLRDGLAGKMREIQNVATGVANGIANSMRLSLKIKSPSRVTMGIGEYAGEGLVNGLLSTFGLIQSTATNAANKITNPLEQAIDSALGILEGYMDGSLNPVITPTLDLSYFNQQAQGLTNLWNGFSVTADMANAAGYGFQRSQQINPSWNAQNKFKETSKTNPESLSGMNQVNNFYISGSDPKAIAEEVEIILQRNVERRNASWA